MAKANIEIGDVVRLKSGGPRMVVDGFETAYGFFGKAYVDPDVVSCTWWDDTEEDFQHNSFTIDTLTKGV